MPRESGFASLRVVALLLCCVGVLLAQAPPRRLVYVLAGQSNIEKLATTTGGPSLSARTNVLYRLPQPSAWAPQTTVPNTPMMVLGDRLGAAHPGDNFEVVMMAKSGSALLERNNALGFGYWMNPNNWGDTFALMNAAVPLVGTALRTMPPNPPPIDEFHIVWGQGETDILQPLVPGVTQTDYENFAQLLFGVIALVAGGTQTLQVHLVTPGAIEASWQLPAPADALRDAYFNMERNPMAPPTGWSVAITNVAHHYDLPHFVGSGGLDPHHLSDAAYVTLANRIADGILTPASLPKITGVLVLNGADAKLATTQPLAPSAFTTAFNNYFTVSDGSPAPIGLTISVQSNTLIFRAVRNWVSPVNIRYVAGSGFNLNWTSGPLATPAPAASPLEPFFVKG